MYYIMRNNVIQLYFIYWTCLIGKNWTQLDTCVSQCAYRYHLLATCRWDCLQILCECDNQEIQKGESGLFLTLVLTLWRGDHFYSHVWRQIIVPPDLAWSFGAICAYYRCHMFYCMITLIHARLKFMRKKATQAYWNCLASLAMNKCRGTITHFHT